MPVSIKMSNLLLRDTWHFGIAAAVLFIVFIIGLGFQRLYWSPLAGIPGPKLAALTSWYECYYDIVLPGQYVFKIKELHKTYGPIIRITPWEISFSDPDFVDAIYAPGAGHRRDKDPESAKGLGTSQALGATVEHGLHKRRRAPLSHLFSRRSVMGAQSGLLEKKSTQLDTVFNRAAESGEVINLSDLYYGMTNDVVCQYSFGSDSNLIDDLSRAHVLRANLSSLLRTTHLGKHFSWIFGLLMVLPIRFAPPGVQDIFRFRLQIREQIDEVLEKNAPEGTDDIPPTIIDILSTDTRLPASEKTKPRLEDEATLAVMAGTDSPAAALSVAHYHMLSNPDIMTRLREELQQQPSDTVEELDRLPYLSAVQMEAYRLNFGLAGRHAMVDPDSPTTYMHGGKTYVIPAGTPMGVQSLVLHTNEDIFPDPWAFNPDRWLGEEGAALRKYILSFNKGARQCLGINLAKAELCIGIAMACRWDMCLHETDDSDVTFQHDYFVPTPKLDSKGVRVKVNSRYR